MEQAIITMAWVEAEIEDEVFPEPAIRFEYPIHRYTDVTEQPRGNITPNPNQVDGLVICDTATMDQIAADPGYTIQPGTRKPAGSDDDSALEVEPNQAEFDSYRAQQLAVIEKETGLNAWTEAQLNDAIGTTPAGRRWRKIVEDCNNYKRSRPKRVEQNTRLNARNQSQGRVGYLRNGNGTLDPTDFQGNQIQQLYTDGTFFMINFRDPITVPGVFRHVKIIHKTLDTPPAFNPEDGELRDNGTAIRWPTSWMFTAAEIYRVKFVE